MPHETNLSNINAVVSRLSPKPEFVIFPGDEIIGLVNDEAELRAQWRHWLGVEMAWHRSNDISIFNSTGNHTVYNSMSERVFQDALAQLPRNGPADQQGLSYFVRDDDLLLVFVNTLWSGYGGEGHVETDWLEQVLKKHTDARWTFVIGHHPVFSVNGYQGDYQRTIGSEYGRSFWQILVENNVFAYLCSHILAFDAQVHDGVLQITTAGAGTAHRMPEDIEYLHCVQAAIDAEGLRYQVLDDMGRIREHLQWPPGLPACDSWVPLNSGVQEIPSGSDVPQHTWRFAGVTPDDAVGTRQTLLAMASGTANLETMWIGFAGPNNRLTVLLQPQEGRSPHYWFGPAFTRDAPFDFQVALHSGMGPGGVMLRRNDGAPWNTLAAASPWGPERLGWQGQWIVGHSGGGLDDLPFRGRNLTIRFAEIASIDDP
jgi:hypothetical protein